MDHLPGAQILWETNIHDWQPVSGCAAYKGKTGYFHAAFDELQDEYEYPRRLNLLRTQ